jgi:hypothetical protein
MSGYHEEQFKNVGEGGELTLSIKLKESRCLIETSNSAFDSIRPE